MVVILTITYNAGVQCFKLIQDTLMDYNFVMDEIFLVLLNSKPMIQPTKQKATKSNIHSLREKSDNVGYDLFY